MSAAIAGATVIDVPGDHGRDDPTVVPFGRTPSDVPRALGRHPAGGGRAAASDEDAEDGVPSERAIAFGLPEGRRWALAAAFERWADLVHGVARQMVGRDHADDVTQQVFVEAWRSRRSFAPDRGEVPGWLVGITRNVARSYLRDLGPSSVEVDADLDADLTTPGADAVVDAVLVANVFRDLPATQRAVLELTLIGEFTQTEAAAHLDVPLGTVKTRHRRGLETLRSALKSMTP